MALRIRRGTTTERQAKTFDLAEPVWDTTLKQLFVGDGTTAGGVDILANANSLVTSVANKTGDVQLSTDDIFENNKLFFETARAVSAVGVNLESTQHVGIQFVLTDGNIVATVDSSFGAGLASIADDLSPQLGANLDLNEFDITGTGNVDITGGITSSSDITAASFIGDLAGDVASSTGIDILTSTIDEVTLNTDFVNFRGQFGIVTGDQINVNASKVVFSNTSYSAAPWFSIGNYQGTNAATTPVAIGRARGTIAEPTAVQDNDGIVNITSLAYDGTAFRAAGSIKCTVAGVVSTNTVPGKWIISASNGTDVIDSLTVGASDVTFAVRGKFPDGTASEPSITFTTDGSVDSGFFHPGDGVICASTDGTERVRIDNGGMRVAGFMKVADIDGSLPDPAEAGMIVLDGTTFKGYNGSAWVTLG